MGFMSMNYPSLKAPITGAVAAISACRKDKVFTIKGKKT